MHICVKEETPEECSKKCERSVISFFFLRQQNSEVVLSPTGSEELLAPWRAQQHRRTHFFLLSPQIKEEHTQWDEISLCAQIKKTTTNSWGFSKKWAEPNISNLYLNINPSFLGGFMAAECVKPVHTKPQKNVCTWRQKRSVFQSVPSSWV